MKKISFLVALLVIVFSAYAQNPPAPEFKNKVLFVDKNNTLADLEKTDLSSNLHTNMGGHSEVNLIANGTGSSVSHSGSTAESFIVKIEPGTDPETAVELFVFDVAKKNRKILVAQMSMGKDQGVELTKAKLAFKKVSDGVYTVTPAAQLEGGEYCFLVNRPNISIMGASSTQSLIGYCFSVAGK